MLDGDREDPSQSPSIRAREILTPVTLKNADRLLYISARTERDGISDTHHAPQRQASNKPGLDIVHSGPARVRPMPEVHLGANHEPPRDRRDAPISVLPYSLAIPLSVVGPGVGLRSVSFNSSGSTPPVRLMK